MGTTNWITTTDNGDFVINTQSFGTVANPANALHQANASELADADIVAFVTATGLEQGDSVVNATAKLVKAGYTVTLLHDGSTLQAIS